MAVVSTFEALISGSTINGQTGAPAFISYSFPTEVPDYLLSRYGAADLATFEEFSEAAKQAAREAIARISQITGITFFEVAPGEGDIKFMAFDVEQLLGESGVAGFAFYPNNGTNSLIASDVFIGHDFVTDPEVLLHELGHAVGLKHPFDDDPTLRQDLDNTGNTVMSYTQGNTPVGLLGQFDIDALQFLYGDETNKDNHATTRNWDAVNLILTQTGTAAGETIFGIGGSDVIDAGGGDDTIWGREGNDVVDGGAGNDEINLGPGSHDVLGGLGNDTITISFRSTLFDFAVDGGDGTDTLTFILDFVTDYIIDFAALLAGSSTLSGIERLVLSFGGNGGHQLNASDLSEDIIAGPSDDIVYAGDGDDFVVGLGGNDTLFGEEGNDTLDTTGGVVALYGGAGDDQGRVVIASSGTQVLFDGGAGFDTLRITVEGTINAVYDLADLSPLGITTFGMEAVQLVASASADEIRDSALLVASRIEGLGGADTIYGSAWNYRPGMDVASTARPYYSGGTGNDLIHLGAVGAFVFGNGGADRYIFDFAEDLAGITNHQLEDFESGADTLDLSAMAVWDLSVPSGSGFITGVTEAGDFSIFVRTSITVNDILLMPGVGASFTGSGQGEALTGDAQDNFLDGLGGADELRGLAGRDVLDGGSGADSMYGGTGDDTYFVDRQDDLVFENAGEGTDTVRSTGDYYLYANVENLILEAGTGDRFGVGNDLANIIYGNDGSNLLLGGGGVDTLYGGAGIDSLFGESGNDTLFGDAGVDYLVGGIGNDVLDGGADADALYGEDGDDTLIGGASFHTDILVGGAGNDILRGDSGLQDYDLLDGGAGDDSYYVDTGDDLTFEAVDGGIDTVYADVAGANNGVYLYANVENLVLLNTTAFGVGNELANTMTGSASANWLLGGAGNDTINGKGGNDVLFGEAGADTFIFEQGTGGDVIGDFTSGEDVIDLQAFGIASFDALKGAFIQNGDVGAINLGNGDFIVLHNVQMDQLTDADFML